MLANRQKQITRFLSRFLILSVLAGTVGMRIDPRQQRSLDIMTNAPQLLQYAAGGHILAFSPEQVYLTGLDHVLTVSFIGGSYIQPQGDAGSEVTDGAASSLGKVVYKNIWPGVDVQYTASAGGIVESSYLMAAGAKVDDIRLKYNVPVKLENGILHYSFESGYMTENAPVAWQEVGGERKEVSVRFEKHGESEVGFALGMYNPKYPVAIDPAYVWHAFYGSADNDFGFGIAVDGSGSVYVLGRSHATWNGPGNIPPKNPYSGGGDFVVIKMDKNGAYQWHAFYGSASDDYDRGIVVDENGNVYVLGRSNASWNGPGDTLPLNAYSGGYDIVVIKLNSAGDYQWHTFYGSTSDDSGLGIAVGGGNIYVTGYSTASWNGLGNALPLNTYSGGLDIVVIQLNSVGVYQWHTFYGSPASNDSGTGIAVDVNGNVYVTGYSNASWNGPGDTTPKNAYNSLNDIVVLKLNNVGAYQWHTFYGSTSDDYGSGVAVDGNGNSYVTGFSYAAWSGPGNVEPLNMYTGGSDVVIFKLDGGGAYQWHTFYGSADYDYSYGIALSRVGNVYVTGYSDGSWDGPGNKAPFNAYSGGADIVVIQLNNSGAYQWHIFYGSASDDFANGIAVDGDGNAYVTGYSQATWNGPQSVAPLNAYNGLFDIVVVKTGPIFADVADTYWAINWIERLYNAGITGGCSASPLMYCPDDTVTRAQMAVFLLKGIHGNTYSPPPATGTVFMDVPANYWAARWAEELAAEGVTGGCGGSNFCPDNNVTRAQMAVFLLKSEHGASYNPPPATGTPFTDVPIDYWAAKWIEQLAAEGITGGCAAGLYCPEDSVTRAQMAVFLVKVFHLP